MAAKRRRGGSRMGAAAFVLAVLFVAVLGSIRYLETERGAAFLLDSGFGSRFEDVQRNLEPRIVGALEACGVKGGSIETGKVEGARGRPVMVLRARVQSGSSLVKVNNEIALAVAGGGGRVRSCRETGRGSELEMEIGTRGSVTHRCVISKERAEPSDGRHAAKSPAIAIIVDDFGFSDNSLVNDIITMDIPLTVSVIPGLRYSRRICKKASGRGKDVLCHLPMEPERGGDDVGEVPLIRVSMDGGEIRKAVAGALESTPGIVGMNNHMGSRATADGRVVAAVLDVCLDKGLFFIDSMTTSRTVVSEVAMAKGLRCLESDLIIDHTEEETRDNMLKLLSIAEKRGRAIGIMHVKRKSVEQLKWFIERARDEGIRFVTASQMIEEFAYAREEGGRS